MRGRNITREASPLYDSPLLLNILRERGQEDRLINAHLEFARFGKYKIPPSGKQVKTLKCQFQLWNSSHDFQDNICLCIDNLHNIGYDI